MRTCCWDIRLVGNGNAQELPQLDEIYVYIYRVLGCPTVCLSHFFTLQFLRVLLRIDWIRSIGGAILKPKKKLYWVYVYQ